MDSQDAPKPPANLRYLVILMWVQLAVLVVAAWFDLFVSEVTTRLLGRGDTGGLWVAVVLCSGAVACYAYLFRPLMRGRRWAFKWAGILMAVQIVANIAISGIAVSASHTTGFLTAATMISIGTIVICGCLYLTPHIAAYIAYHDAAADAAASKDDTIVDKRS